MEDNFLNTVLSYYRENNWKEIVKLNEDSKNEYALNLLWVWPSVENLEFIKRKLVGCGLNGVISLGCGCGLFEWILKQYIDLPVLGYEVNKEWWSSKYSNPLFIKHVYPKLPISEDCLYPDYALLFCYFNDASAFIDYVTNYRGNVIFIIGPGKGRGTHTEPEPFNPKFGSSEWKLESSQEVKDSKDFIAVYVRNRNADVK